MSELKPCPFCGGEATIQPEGDYHEIHCDGCGIELDRRTYDEAVTAWNARAETEAEKKIEQIRACIESYRIKKNESDPFEYGRFQEWRAIKTDIDEILEGKK
jgi:Lar family restriction alleviation protein